MSLVQHVHWATIAPPVILLVTAILALVSDLFLPARRRALVVWLSMTGTLGAIAWTGWLASVGTRTDFCVGQNLAGALASPIRQAGAIPVPGTGPACSYIADSYAAFFQILVLAALVVVLLLIRSALDSDRLPAGETCFLLLASVSGMVVLASARDLLTLIVALEVVSLPAFVLVGLKRSDPRSAQSALTFFVISVVSTAISLYGMALLYGVTGSLQLSRIEQQLAVTRLTGGPKSQLAAAAIVLVIAGFVFKVAAVPFHAWAPDTYQGSPLPIAALLSVASKAAGFAGLIALLVDGFTPYAPMWGVVIGVIAALTMTVGNLVALRQWHAVRLLAWSTVAQGGYLLVPLAVASTRVGREPDVLHHAVAATLSYLGIYAAMNLGAFAVVVAVSRGSARRGIADYRGLASRSPWLAAALALFLTALAGLPPGVSGLIAKVVVFRSAVHGHVTWLAVIAAVNTVIGLAYYLRFAALPFLGVGDRSEPASDRVRVPKPVGAALALTAVATLALSVYPQPLLHAACTATAEQQTLVRVVSSDSSHVGPSSVGLSSVAAESQLPARCPGNGL
jgi:NADH-quinone oxidoreductase subunit N